MSFQLIFLALPVIFLVLLIWAAARWHWRAVGLALAMFVGSIAVAYWANDWSGSDSWADFLVLPDVGAIAGLLALGGAIAATAQRRSLRNLGIAALVLSLAVPSAYVDNKWRHKQRIAAAVVEQAAPWRALQGKRTTIATMPAPALEEMLLERMHDRDFVFEALKREDLSPELLEQLLDAPALKSDLDLTFAVVRHPRTSGRTLTRVFERADKPVYFYTSLAAQPNTPPEVMRAIWRAAARPDHQLDEAFAGNPAAPREILDEISRTTAGFDAGLRLLTNPSSDCTLARQLVSSPAATAGYRSEEVRLKAQTRAASTSCGTAARGRN